MIKFRCSSCSQKIGVPDEYAGKNVKCPNCGTVNSVPIPDPTQTEEPANDNHNDPSGFGFTGELLEHEKDTIKPSTDSQQPQNRTDAEGYSPGIKIAFGCCGVGFLSLLILLLWAFVFRDTWEIDNWDEISNMCDSVQQLTRDGQYKEALAEYEEVLAFVGTRELKQDGLRRDLIEVQESCESLKKRMKAEEKHRLEIEAEITRKGREGAKVWKEKVEARRKAEAERIEAEKQAEKARILAIERERQRKEEALKAQQLAEEQETQRLRNERISKGYLTARETADNLVVKLLNNGTLQSATISSVNTTPVGDKVDIIYNVTYVTRGGLFRQGQCAIALNSKPVSQSIQDRYGIRKTWNIIVAFVDETNVWGWNKVERYSF